MKNHTILFAILALTGLLSFPALAALEPSYQSGKTRAVVPWYGKVDAESLKADLDFVAGMRPHHAGALTMSEEYLNDKDASSALLKQLARGIIHNQKFEISMLDTVEEFANKALAEGKSAMRRIATKGLAQQQRFYRAPIPGPWAAGSESRAVSVADVKFSKAMIIHHQGALDMCNDYLADPRVRNGYLKRMCLDILVDQSQEIAFMESIIGDYHGDAAAITIDPSMIHGMEGMKHAGHGAAHTKH